MNSNYLNHKIMFKLLIVIVNAIITIIKINIIVTSIIFLVCLKQITLIPEITTLKCL